MRKYWNEHKSLVWKDDKNGKIVWVVSTYYDKTKKENYYVEKEIQNTDIDLNRKLLTGNRMTNFMLFIIRLFLYRVEYVFYKKNINSLESEKMETSAVRWGCSKCISNFGLTIKVYEYLIINSALIFNKDWKQ